MPRPRGVFNRAPRAAKAGAVPPAAPPAAFALLGSLGMLWGLTPAMGKLAVTGGIGPLAYALLYALFAAAFLGGVAAARRAGPPVGPRALGFFAVNGLVGFATPGAVSFVVLQHVPAGLLAMVLPSSPLFTFLFAAAVGLERATARRGLGSALAFAGTALALAPGAALPHGGSLGWAALSLLVPGCYAASNLFAMRFRPAGAAPLALAAGTTAAAALWLVPAAALGGGIRPPAADGATLIAAAQGAVVAVAYLIYFRLLTRLGAVFVSQVGYLIVLTGLFWGWVFFAEVPGLLALPATVLIFAGLALAHPARRG